MKNRPFIIILLCSILLLMPTIALCGSYFGYIDYGGTWYDANKSTDNYDDDLLCWAATASNIFAYTGWGFPAQENFTDVYDIFNYYQVHWENKWGDTYYGAEWWFDGTNNTPGYLIAGGMADVDVPGGGFWPDYNFWDYYVYSTDTLWAMNKISTYLQEGRGVGLSLFGSVSHAITAWGVEYSDDDGRFTGVYVTDSDDDQYYMGQGLMYYDMEFRDDKWYFLDFYGQDDCYIKKVLGIAQCPISEPVPEPTTMLLLGSGLVGLAGFRRRFKKA